MNRTNHFPRTARTALILLLATLLNTTTAVNCIIWSVIITAAKLHIF